MRVYGYFFGAVFTPSLGVGWGCIEAQHVGWPPVSSTSFSGSRNIVPVAPSPRVVIAAGIVIFITLFNPKFYRFGRAFREAYKNRCFINTIMRFNSFGSSEQFVDWQHPNPLSHRERVGVRGRQSKRPVSVRAHFEGHPGSHGSKNV